MIRKILDSSQGNGSPEVEEGEEKGEEGGEKVFCHLEEEKTVAPKLSRNIPGAPGSVSEPEGVRWRMRYSHGSLSPRQSWPGLGSLGNQLDFPCTSHPASQPAEQSTALPNGCSLGCLTGCHESKTYGGCNRGAEIAVAPDNPQDGLSFIHGISINDWKPCWLRNRPCCSLRDRRLDATPRSPRDIVR